MSDPVTLIEMAVDHEWLMWQGKHYCEDHVVWCDGCEEILVPWKIRLCDDCREEAEHDRTDIDDQEEMTNTEGKSAHG